MPLTLEQEDYKRQIEDVKRQFDLLRFHSSFQEEHIQRQIAESTMLVDELMRNCRHFVEPSQTATSARCAICGSRFRWYCPNSPDHACHYHSHNGLVLMINRFFEPVPEGHDAENESEEWCIYCGQPYEQK